MKPHDIVIKWQVSYNIHTIKYRVFFFLRVAIIFNIAAIYLSIDQSKYLTCDKSYASRRLGKSEENYPAMKLEFLCLKWAVTEKFYDYLYGNKFKVKTDNNPLTYIYLNNS